METKERIIDLKQYFLYIWENIIAVLFVAGILALCFAGFNYKKQKDVISSSNAQQSTNIHSIMSMNHDSYYHISDEIKYSDSFQPDETYNSTIRLYVDFDFSSIEGSADYDFSQVASKVQQDSMLLLVSDQNLQKVIDENNLRDYPDMKDITTEDLKWLINKNYRGANIMQVVVTDVNGERAQKIAQSLAEIFVDNIATLPTVENARIMEPASSPVYMPGPAHQTNVNKKTLLKYGIIGGFSGGVLSLMILFLLFIFRDVVRTAFDVSFSDMNTYGMISKNKKKWEEDCKRLAYSLLIHKEYNKIVLVPIDRYSEKTDIEDKIDEIIKHEKQTLLLERVNNIKDSSDAIRVAPGCDAVVLLGTYGKTKMKDLLYAKRELDKTEVENLGVVLCDMKHI